MSDSAPPYTPFQDQSDDSNDSQSATLRPAPPIPSNYRRSLSYRSDTYPAYQSLNANPEVTETTSLLGDGRETQRRAPLRSYTSISATSALDGHFKHTLAAGSLRRSRHPSHTDAQNLRLSQREGTDTSGAESLPASTKDGMLASSFLDDRAWYDQFTSTDWVHDSVADGIRLRELRNRRDIRGRLLALFDGAQGWILVAVTGCIIAAIAYVVDVSSDLVFDLKEGFCTTRWFQSRSDCCPIVRECSAWLSWSQIFKFSSSNQWVDFGAFVLWVVVLSMISCLLTLLTKTVVPSSVSLTTLDENLGADRRHANQPEGTDSPASISSANGISSTPLRPAMVYYSAAGSGVAEVKVINSGFVLHGYLGLKTLAIKTIALIFSVASGLSIGKEGPYVHIGACVGNICCRLFSKYNCNDGKRREVISASSAGGIAVAFGAPIAGSLFSLEEVSYYFPPKTLFRTFFCCIAAALSLKFLNPYGTGKIVLFQVRYLGDWEIFEMVLFILLGALGGALGALFIKATGLWARSFRRIPIIKRSPMLEIILVALLTGLLSFWNQYAKMPISELMFELARPCDDESLSATGLCPTEQGIGEIILCLLVAFVIKSFLTIVTFGNLPFATLYIVIY